MKHILFAIAFLLPLAARQTMGAAAPVAAKDKPPTMSITKVVVTEGRYATTRGYPATSKKVYELTRKNHPKGPKAYDALIKRVLVDTTYLGQVPLGQYIGATLFDPEKAKAIDAKGPSDHGQKKGSGRTFSFHLEINGMSSYRFRHDRWRSEVYSGDAVQELLEVVRSTRPVVDKRFGRPDAPKKPAARR